MIDAAIANASFFHVPYNPLESCKVFGRITVQFYIGNMTGISKSMIRSFNIDFVSAGRW